MGPVRRKWLHRADYLRQPVRLHKAGKFLMTGPVTMTLTNDFPE